MGPLVDIYHIVSEIFLAKWETLSLPVWIVHAVKTTHKDKLTSRNDKTMKKTHYEDAIVI